MKRQLKNMVIPIVLFNGLFINSFASAATNWPERAVTLVVPFAPGGSTDTTARQVAAELSDVLGQTVIVDNRGGAGGNIGAGIVAKAAADGYTYLFATNAHAASMTLYKQLSYDLKKDLVPVAQVVSFPNVLVVRPEFEAQTLEQFIDYASKKKGPINYGSAGNGSSHHLAGALLNRMIEGNMSHVPFKGGAPANVALLAGQIQANVAPLIEVMPYLNSGKLKALAVTTPERSPLYPDVPPMNSALPGYEIRLWSGILAPSGTSAEIINKMNAAIREVLKRPAVVKKFTSMGYSMFDEPVSALDAIYDQEIKRWGELVEISGAQTN